MRHHDNRILGIIALVSAAAFAEPLRVTGEHSEPLNIRWQVVNDTVMGGASRSRVATQDGQVRFTGQLNTNGGGFASLRSNRQDWDLSAFSVVRLKVRGDGRNYRFRLSIDGDRASYQSEFGTSAGTAQIVELPINAFYPSWRGRRLQRPPLAASNITGMGLMLADGKDGHFDLMVEWIEFDHFQPAQYSD